MDVHGLGWLGVRTAEPERLVAFFTGVLGAQVAHHEKDFWAFDLPDGGQVEVFGEEYPGKAHFTGPVVGFWVDDLPASVEQLRSAGVELLGEPGPSWQHFRGPDGNVYELKERPAGHA
ncbi:VOC family protein [Streptomyces griseoviridis]|uniref:VOC family protein n=1 Tax=Streptomyces griseoviridis TaxID=45398 RepID=UPI0033E0F78A